MHRYDCAPCSICGQAHHVAVLKKNAFDIVRCESCGMIHAEPLLSPDEIEDLYRGDPGPGKPSVRRSRLWMARWVARITGGGDILEIGCQSGDFLAAARHIGLRAYGMDTNPDAVARARARGLDVREGSLEKPSYGEASFDVVFLEQVVEHLRDPVEGFVQVRNLLRPGGHAIAITPGYEHQRARMAGDRWHYYMPPIHLHYYSKRSVNLLCRKVGLELVRASVFHYHTHLTIHAKRP